VQRFNLCRSVNDPTSTSLSPEALKWHLNMKKLLFLTNADWGLASVVLATIHELLETTKDVEIHVASVQGMRAPVEKIATATAAGPRLQFHVLDGLSITEAAFRPSVGVWEGFSSRSAMANLSVLPAILIPWSPDEYMAIYEQTNNLLRNVIKPDLTVVEPFFSPGLTLCYRHLKTDQWLVLAPNSFKEFAIAKQPNGAMFWKYPL
jgi:hypothetical protein